MNTISQFMSFNTTNGIANLAIERILGAATTIIGYGFVNLSDRVLKTNVRDLSEKELQETFEAVEPRMFECRLAGPWARRYVRRTVGRCEIPAEAGGEIEKKKPGRS